MARIDDTGPRGYVLLDFTPESYGVFDDAHRRGGMTEFSQLALPGGGGVDLQLRPIEVWEAGGRALVVGVDGETREMAPTVRLFSVHVKGRSSTGFIGVSPQMMHGYLDLEGERYVLSTGSGDGHPLAVSHSDAVPIFADSQFCNVLNDVEEGDAAGEPENLSRAAPKLSSTKVFLECDKRFRDRFSNTQATIDYATLLVGATSEIYRRDLGTKINLPNGYLRVWESTPPWGNTSTFGDLNKFMTWWKSGANSNSGVGRAQVHLLSYPVFGGVANGIGVTCSKLTSFAISSCYGSFPYPLQHTNSNNWDVVVFAHESGHLYGSQHTFDYTPPIQCDDGSGPDKGTIMSYCHQTYGVVGIGLRFHRRVQDVMRMDLASKACAITQNLKRGDYTGEGTVDPVDLAVFDAVAAQGFLSRAAVEVFDMDIDGDMDAEDRIILDGKANFARASSTLFNGTGSNCGNCYLTITQPILGQVWSTQVGGFLGVPINTLVIGAMGKLTPGVNTKWGELLITLSGFGGSTLFQSLVRTDGQTADHNIALPLDASFVGVTVETQAALFKPTGLELANGITLFVSTY